jgi:hypothetical protein
MRKQYYKSSPNLTDMYTLEVSYLGVYLVGEGR